MTNNANEVFTMTDGEMINERRERRRDDAVKRLAECFRERESQLQAMKEFAERFHGYVMNEDLRKATAQIEGINVLLGQMEMTKTQIKVLSKKVSEE